MSNPALLRLLREEFERIQEAPELSLVMAACQRGIAMIDQSVGGQTEPYTQPEAET